MNNVQNYIKKEFRDMNDMQFAALTHTRGPLLILAGAGSGKTTVLINRIANLIRFGDAYNTQPSLEAQEAAAKALSDRCFDIIDDIIAVNPVKPYNILAITFTNKAAGELKERLEKMLGSDGVAVWAGTFHATCAKILRYSSDHIDYSRNFLIYDTDDQRRIMKQIVKRLEIDEKALPVRNILYEISSQKDKLITPEEYADDAGHDYRKKQIAEAYFEYQKALFIADAMDFDDIICNTVQLFRENEEVLRYYQNRFKHIMVDEYQDTNHAQYELISLLASRHKNICVVGDDDQSIYKFRGATVENILDFEKQYKNAVVIRLEQNYRSTEIILNAANKIIKNNSRRKGKNLWTENGEGEKIFFIRASDELEEAKFIANTVLNNTTIFEKFSDHAVLYRTNAQANIIETTFARSGVPYRVIGGHRFYERKEIKDVMSYLSVISNFADTVRLRRIVNEPKRGIGDTTVNNAAAIANELGITLFEVFCKAEQFETIKKAAAKLSKFTEMIINLSELSKLVSIHELLEHVLAESGYIAALEAEGAESEDRIQNVNELKSSIKAYEIENEDATLSGFLEEIALITDIDAMNGAEDRVVLMTLHCAKGLEFPHVFLTGLEEGIFPGNLSIMNGEAEIEEERRLAYVGVTRAKKQLYLSCAARRMLYGETRSNHVSRFAREIPEELINEFGIRSSEFGTKDEYKFQKPVNSEYDGSLSERAVRTPHSEFSSSSAFRIPHSDSTPAVIYSPNEKIRHKTFGDGVIKNVTKMGNDYLLEINFDIDGTKKLMAKFANLTKIDG